MWCCWGYCNKVWHLPRRVQLLVKKMGTQITIPQGERRQNSLYMKEKKMIRSLDLGVRASDEL